MESSQQPNDVASDNLTKIQDFLISKLNIEGASAKLDAVAQDLLVSGMQTALNKNNQLKLSDPSEFQARFSEAIIVIVQTETLPAAPVFINTATQINDSQLKWQWMSGGNGSHSFRYYFSGQKIGSGYKQIALNLLQMRL